ncbi:diguanylate cyclase domain-containing protein [Vibrio metschnikovii]
MPLGDQVLQSVAQCMQDIFNHEDNELVARFGGEEFCLYSKQAFPIVIEARTTHQASSEFIL